MSIPQPCARLREGCVNGASELGSAKPNSNTTYDDDQISHTRGDTMVTATSYLSNASSKVDSDERYI